MIERGLSSSGVSPSMPDPAAITRVLILLTSVAIMLLCLTAETVMSADGLIYSSNLTYLGAFRLPSGPFGGSSFDYNRGAMAYNSSNDSLFVSGHMYNQGCVAEITIPTSVNSTDINSLNTASILQNFADISEGNLANIGAGGSTCSATINLGGIMVYGNKLIGTSYIPYDGSGCSVRSHFYSGKTVATIGDYHGMYELSGTPGASFVDKAMTPVPSTWRTSLGGPALTGATGMSIVSRASWGPDAFAFDPDQLGIMVPLPATPLLYYNQTHKMFGTADWNQTNPYWNGTTRIEGMHFIQGTRTVLFFGVHGTGTYCYGDVPPCVDPIDSSKGDHSSEYKFQFWAYDANDLAAVKAGTKQPWEPTPYSVWNVTLPYGGVRTMQEVGGSAYNPASQTLYVMQARGDRDGMPVIHVFQISLPPSPAALTPRAPTQLRITP